MLLDPVCLFWLFDDHQPFTPCQLASIIFLNCLTLFSLHAQLRIILTAAPCLFTSGFVPSFIVSITCLCLSLFPASISILKNSFESPYQVRISCCPHSHSLGGSFPGPGAPDPLRADGAALGLPSLVGRRDLRNGRCAWVTCTNSTSSRHATEVSSLKTSLASLQ